MIRAVVFDFFGVLTNDGIRELKEAHPDPATREEIAEITRANDLGELSGEAFSARMAEAVGETEPRIYDQFYGSAKLDQKLLAIIDQLHKSYRTGLLSNASQSSIDTYWSRDEMMRHFDEVVLSAEVRLLKPDPAIYRLTCDRLEVQPDEAIFVDDVDSFVQAAHAVGMSGIHFTSTAHLHSELVKLGLLTKS